MRYKFLLFLFLNIPASFACTMMSSNGATLVYDTVSVWVSSDAVCTDADTTGDEVLSLAEQAAAQFWNTISASRLRFVVRGFWNQNASRYETGKTCVDGVDCDNTTVPNIQEIIISCNSHAQNFSSNVYAKTAISVRGEHITGANILINNTVGSVFGNLSKQQKLWVIAHELGHAAGLGHSKSSANLMFYTLTPQRFALGQEDYWGMSFLYPVKQDGCGLMGTVKNQDENDTSNRNLSFLIGILLGVALIIFQKVFLKAFKFIF